MSQREVINNNLNFSGYASNIDNVNKIFYIGNWRNSQRHGEGKLFNLNGIKIYEGEWKKDNFEGKGIYYYSNNHKYIGYFKKGKINGFGKYYNNNELLISGRWRDGKLVAKY